MKKYLFGLIGVALLGGNPLMGQTPSAVPNGPGDVPVGAPVLADVPVGVACTPVKTTCVPEHYIKKITKVVYCSGCEPLCPGYFCGLFRHCGCDSGHCEHCYTRRYLVKKSKTCEENATRCVPAKIPACEYGHP